MVPFCPKAFTDAANVEFNDDEKRLWSEATRIFERIKVDKRHIVRNRDSANGNAIVFIPPYRTLDDLLELFGVTAKDKIDQRVVDEAIYDVDLQYRYGHILEDIAHIATEYDSAFIFKNAAGKFATKRVFSVRERFFDKIQKKETIAGLENDDTSFYLMMLYRTIRKMYLFTTYWERTCHERGRNELSSYRYDDRRVRFAENIKHHYVLGRMITHKLNLLMSDDAEKTSEKDELHRIRTHSKLLTPQEVRQHIYSLKAGEGTQSQLDMERLYVLHALLERIGARFKDKYALVNWASEEAYQ